MKTSQGNAILLILSVSIASALGQVRDDFPPMPYSLPAYSTSPVPDPSEWANTSVDWFQSIRQFPQSITNNQTGEVTSRVCQVMAVGNGLNYIDSNGAWQPSQDLIEITPDSGAQAVRAPNKVFFGPTLSPLEGIKIVTRSNIVLTTFPIGVYYFDPTTGKEALLAALTNKVAGKYVPPNRILYPAAFHSDLFDADLRITVTKEAVECDTIITHQPKVTPQTFSMSPSTTLLQVRHEWTVPVLPNVTVGQTPVGGLTDSRIDFGEILFARGRAFAWNGGVPADTNTPARIDFVNVDPEEPVGKTWQNGTPSILTESVQWANVAPKLAQLPLMAKGGSGHPTKSAKRIELADAALKSPAFVLDWIIVSSATDYTFNSYNGTNTYWLQSSAGFGGVVTFNANCIIKRAPGATLALGGSGVNDLVCNGTCSAPSIITVQDDNMYGEQTGTNCASTDAAVALMDEVRGANVAGMNIRYAGTGVELTGECCVDDRNFQNCTIEFCQTGVIASACNVSIQNSVISCVTTPTATTSSGTITGSWGSTCNQISLQAAVVSGMEALTNRYHSGQNLFTGYYAGYNTNCWLYNLDGYASSLLSGR